MKDVSKIKKQREVLRNRIRSDIQKLAVMAEISQFQAIHMILDKMIIDVDNQAKLYSSTTIDKWEVNLAESYLPSTLEIVQGMPEPAPAPKENYHQGAVKQDKYGFESFQWNGYGPLTEQQYGHCQVMHDKYGTAVGSEQAKLYMNQNKEFHGQKADLLIVDDLPPTKVLGKADDWNYTLQAEHAYQGSHYKGMKLGEYLDKYVVQQYEFTVCDSEKHLVKLHYVPGVSAYKLIPRPPKSKGKLTMNKANELLQKYYVQPSVYKATEDALLKDIHQEMKKEKFAKTYGYGTIKVSPEVKAVHEAVYGGSNKQAFAKAVESEMLEVEAKIINEVEDVVCGPPKEKFWIVGKGGAFYYLVVGKWYTGQFLASLGCKPKDLKAPAGHVWVYHPTKDLAKCVVEIKPVSYGEKLGLWADTM